MWGGCRARCPRAGQSRGAAGMAPTQGHGLESHPRSSELESQQMAGGLTRFPPPTRASSSSTAGERKKEKSGAAPVARAAPFFFFFFARPEAQATPEMQAMTLQAADRHALKEAAKKSNPQQEAARKRARAQHKLPVLLVGTWHSTNPEAGGQLHQAAAQKAAQRPRQLRGGAAAPRQLGLS